MSLEQAAALFDYQQRQRNPLDRGLQAGQSAYDNTRAMYQNTGASKDIYDYLEGRGAYPVNQYPAGGIQQPYEQASGISGGKSQQELAQAAKDAPWRGGTSPTSSGSRVQMPQQSALSQLIGIAGPAYLGYKFLVPDAAKNWLANETGFESLGATAKGSAATSGAGSAGAGSAAADASPYAATSTTTIEPLRGPVETAQFEGYPGGDYSMTGANAEAATSAETSSFLTPGQQSYYYADGTAIPASDAAVSTVIPQATTAPIVSGTAAGTELGGISSAAPAVIPEGAVLSPATGEPIAAGWTYSAETGSLVPVTTSEQLTAANLSGGTAAATTGEAVATDVATEEAAASMGGADLAALTAEYGPYIAAAIIADQVLFDGKLSRGIDDYILQPIGNAVSDIYHGVENVVSDIGSGIGNVVSDAGDFVSDTLGGLGDALGFAEGGETVGGLAAAAQHYNLGGYSDGGRLLKGPGDGVSDSIPATIGDKRPARLADGEFVVPARIVSELGNGSTEAGARKLYAMMDRIQSGRKKSIGKSKVAVNSRADKHLPA